MALSVNHADADDRIKELVSYYEARILTGDRRFVCGSAAGCGRSAERVRDAGFHAAQGIMVGGSFSLTCDGVPLRVLIVPMETGRARERVTVPERTKEVQSWMGYPWRRWNPHMRGAGLGLQLTPGLPVDTGDGGLCFTVGFGEPVHILDAYAMANLLVCSAKQLGTAKSRATEVMRRNCSSHLAATVAILEPTLVISQGVTLYPTLRRMFGSVREFRIERDPAPRRELPPDVMVCQAGGRSFVWANLRHPARSWEWSSRPYFTDVAVPVVELARELALDVTAQPRGDSA